MGSSAEKGVSLKDWLQEKGRSKMLGLSGTASGIFQQSNQAVYGEKTGGPP